MWPSLKSSLRDDSNEWSHHRVWLRNKKVSISKLSILDLICCPGQGLTFCLIVCTGLPGGRWSMAVHHGGWRPDFQLLCSTVYYCRPEAVLTICLIVCTGLPGGRWSMAVHHGGWRPDLQLLCSTVYYRRPDHLPQQCSVRWLLAGQRYPQGNPERVSSFQPSGPL